MGRQSTRHKYRSRREKNASAGRVGRLMAYGVVIFIAIILLKNWREYWAYLKTYFY